MDICKCIFSLNSWIAWPTRKRFLNSGIEGDLEKGEILGITYANLVAVLTKAIQEQQLQIEAQQKKIDYLLKLVEAPK